MERPTRPYAPGGREDCWSDDATSVLITAWGDRYLRLNRGNLRQKDWKEVADAVNSRRDGAVFKTDGQCKNRIDTLKKKYKLEKSKPFPSTWIFYNSLDSLIGVPSSNAAVLTRPPKPLTLALTLKSAADPSPLGFRRCGSTESDGEDDGEGGGVGLAGGAACRELARAILKFGEIYERMESSKQEQMVELEKQRMAFTKELEVQRLNMFMDAQLELEKMKKRPKYSKHSSGKKLCVFTQERSCELRMQEGLSKIDLMICLFLSYMYSMILASIVAARNLWKQIGLCCVYMSSCFATEFLYFVIL